MNVAIQFLICSVLMVPYQVWAQTVVKDPLAYPLRQYAFILAVSMAGGFVSWYAQFKRGSGPISAKALIGELTTSAFAGVLSFWACEWLNVSPLITAGIAGIVGHMGGRAITWAEEVLQRRASVLVLPGDAKP